MLLPVLILPVIAVYRSARLSAEKEHQALHDGLTDLPNRLQFASIMERRFEHGRNRSVTGAVLLIDLDRFKEINDTLGHQAGDTLLCLIGPRIQQVLPPTGSIARLGGDEFAVLVPDVDVGRGATIGAAIVDSLLVAVPSRRLQPRGRGEHRHRHVPRARHDGGPADQAGRHRHVRGQGTPDAASRSTTPSRTRTAAAA